MLRVLMFAAVGAAISVGVGAQANRALANSAQENGGQSAVQGQPNATQNSAAGGAMGLLEMYQGYEADTMSDLSKAHRNVREIGEWVSSTVANSLLFRPGQSRAQLAAIRPNFNEAGFLAYMRFLGSTTFAQALQADTLNVSTIVNNAPLLIGQSASGGRHAWAFEMPIIMTQAGSTAVRPITIRVQVGRAADAPAPHHVLIENWQIFEEDVQNAE